MEILKVGVGVCTRARPHMFRALLKELAKQKAPKNAEVHFIFIENDTDVHIAGTVNDFKQALIAKGMVDPKICIEPEPKIGIGFARNRMLEIALHFNLDFLAAIDDDDYPQDENWLHALVTGAVTRDLDIASGLSKYEPLGREELYSFQLISRLLYGSIAQEFCDRERKLIERHRRGEDVRLRHGGSNVIYRLSFLQQNNIRFKNLGLGRGEDLEIGHEIKQAGGKSGLIPEAAMYERVHPERLTLRYQFQVQRANCIVNYGSCGLVLSRKNPVARGSAFVFARLITGTIALLLIPITGGKTLLGATKSFGRCVGVIEGLLGAESRHYCVPDGR